MLRLCARLLISLLNFLFLNPLVFTLLPFWFSPWSHFCRGGRWTSIGLRSLQGLNKDGLFKRKWGTEKLICTTSLTLHIEYAKLSKQWIYRFFCQQLSCWNIEKTICDIFQTYIICHPQPYVLGDSHKIVIGQLFKESHSYNVAHGKGSKYWWNQMSEVSPEPIFF